MRKTYDPGAAECREPPPHASLAGFLPLPEGAEQYPIEYIESKGVIKLREEESAVSVGICTPEDESLCRTLRGFHGKAVTFHRIDRAELAGYLGRRLAVLEPGGQGSVGAPAEDRILLDRLANDAPIVNLVNSLMIDGIRAGASDIHVESFAEQTRVRYRVDGALRTVGTIDRERTPAVCSRIKIMANLNIMERRLPQDGRITVHLGSDVYDVRVSILPIAAGESIVLRLFGSSGTPLDLSDLGLEEEDLRRVAALAAAPHGLVLATGPTGSGKTTTLNAMIRSLRSEQRKIVSIEDPVEYLVDGVDQVQTHDAIGLSFDSLLRRVLRHDPDIIMVGEIRDAPTAQIAVRAALTGHLVLSTLHTNDAVSVVPRLADMGVEPYLIGAVLRGALSQRLVRVVCRDCRRQVSPSVQEEALLERHGLRAEYLSRGEGCAACGGTGYRGRTAIAELWSSDGEMESLIARNERVPALRSYLTARGLRSLAAAGLAKAMAGITTVEEVERVTGS